MQDYRPAKLLRLHFSQEDRHQGRPLYEAIVQRCMELQSPAPPSCAAWKASATPRNPPLRASWRTICRSSIQIVDSEENIRRLLPVVEEMMDKGLIAMSEVGIKRKRKRNRDQRISTHYSFAAMPRAFILRYRWLRSSPSMSAARVTLPLASSSFLTM